MVFLVSTVFSAAVTADIFDDIAKFQNQVKSQQKTQSSNNFNSGQTNVVDQSSNQVLNTSNSTNINEQPSTQILNTTNSTQTNTNEQSNPVLNTTNSTQISINEQPLSDTVSIRDAIGQLLAPILGGTGSTQTNATEEPSNQTSDDTNPIQDTIEQILSLFFK